MKNANTLLYRSLQSLPCSKAICWSCRIAGLRWSSSQSRKLHSYSSERSYRRDERISSIAKRIQETGKLPSLPTASTFDLSTLPRQRPRRLRNQNIIRNDIKATVDAHYAANVLAHGNIHIKLGDSSYPEPRRLAVTPPNHVSTPGHTSYQGTEYGQNYTIREHKTTALKHETRDNLIESPKKIQEVIVASELQNRLSEIDPDLDAWRRLDAEIRVFQEWIEPNQDENNMVSDTWSRFQQTIGKRFPEYKFELQGSRVSGLARPFSDIDIRLIIRKFDRTNNIRGRSFGRRAIRRDYMSALLSVKKWLQEVATEDFTASAIRDARVPLLEIQDQRQRGLKLELSIPVGRPTKHNMEFIKYFRTEYPQIKPLFLLLRWWLEISGIGNASNGGVSSYLTFCMVLTSITHSARSFRGEEFGEQLLHFLRFWIKADWKALGYAPDPARTFPKFAVNIVEEPVAMNTATRQAMRNLSVDIEDETHFSQPNLIQNDDADSPGEIDQDSTQETWDTQNSDIYLEGIKFLTHQANNFRRTSDKRQAYFLLQDPANPRNNIGASLKRLPELQSLMRRALRRLEQRIRNWNRQKLATETVQPQEFLLQDLVYIRSRVDLPTSQPDKAVQEFEKKRRRLAVDIAKKARSESFEQK